jgi:hypothetical protein
VKKVADLSWKTQKFIREDEVVESIQSKLGDLICPPLQIISWLTNLLRSDFKLTIDNNQEAQEAITASVQRIQRMDGMLYDDKLAGLISTKRYREKHDSFVSEIKRLEKQKGGISQQYEQKYMNGISVIELAQDAKQLFNDPEASNDEKRIILTKLFKNITVKDSTVSVTYTKLVQVIACEQGRFWPMANNVNQTKNTSENNGGTLDAEAVSAMICSVWQGLTDTLRTFDGKPD